MNKYSYRSVIFRPELHAPHPGRPALWNLTAAPVMSYLDDPAAVEMELVSYWSTKEPIGFDLEWDPKFHKGGGENPVALIQMASRSRIVLVQLPIRQPLPPTLVKLLADPAIIKVGVGIAYDAKKLLRDNGAYVAGAMDLSPFAHKIYPDDWSFRPAGSTSIALARLTEKYLGLPMAKGKVQRSFWSRKLDAVQQDYAASDAYAAIELLYVFLKELDALPSPALQPLQPWEQEILGREHSHNLYVYTLIRTHLPELLQPLKQQQQPA